VADRRPLAVVTNWRDLEHPQAGGAELVVDHIARELVDQGYRTVLLASAVDGKPRQEEVSGYTVRRRGGQFTVYAWALLWLLMHRRSVSVVIDSQNGIPFFSPLAVSRRTPCLLLLHHIHQEQFGLYFPAPVAMVGRLLEGFFSRLVYGERAIITVSPSTRQGAREILGLRGPIRIAPPGWAVTLDLGRGLPAKTEHPSVVTVGRLVPHKRTAMAVEAVAALRATIPGLTLDVVGGGTELEPLQKLAAELGIADAVTFHPGCTDEVRDAVTARSWLCVNASEGEGWGISVIEANGLGTPVLAYSRPGLRDSIQDGVNGWLLADDVPLADGVAASLGQLGTTQQRADAAWAAYEWAMGFTWQEMGRRVLDAVALEERRLGLSHPDRRGGADVSTVVHVPSRLLPAAWDPALRDGDVLTHVHDGVDLFFAGADTAGARVALRRIGLAERVAEADVEYRVAKRRDHLTPPQRSLRRSA